MQITREDLNPCTIKLTIVSDPDEVRQGFDKAFKQIAKKVKLPGFRPGHAPKAMLEKVIAKEDLYDQAADNIVRDAFKKALEEEKLEPDTSTRPTVELTTLNDEEGKCEFWVKVPLPPKVQLGDYKNLPVERPPLDVSEEEVEAQIEGYRRRQQTREAVTDRGVIEGDVAVVNIKIEGEEGEGRNFMTIAGQTFKELDELLLGMRPEEMKNAELPFPANFQEKDWAGQTKKTQVTLNSLSAVKLPELDDAFAQSLNLDNVDQLKSRMREAIGQAKMQMTTEMLNEQLLDRLHERSEVHVSDNMWEDIAARRLQETAEEQKKAGKTMEQYAQESGMTIEQLVDAWKDKARVAVERSVLMNEVFRKENMQLTNQDLNMELAYMSAEYEVKPEEMLELLKKNNAVNELQFRAMARKVNEFLLSQADVKEVAGAPA